LLVRAFITCTVRASKTKISAADYGGLKKLWPEFGNSRGCVSLPFTPASEEEN
jgi:hypothetical protein